MKVGRYPSNTVFSRKVISVCEAWSSPTYLAEVVASRKVTLRDRNPWSTCSSSLKNRAPNSLSATKRYHWGIGLRTEDLTLMEPEAWSWDKCHPRNADMAATWTFRVDVVSPLSRPSYRNSNTLLCGGSLPSTTLSKHQAKKIFLVLVSILLVDHDLDCDSVLKTVSESHLNCSRDWSTFRLSGWISSDIGRTECPETPGSLRGGSLILTTTHLNELGESRPLWPDSMMSITVA